LFACNAKETDTSIPDTEDTAISVVDPTTELVDPSGCSDFVFFDRNTSDSVLLELRGEGLAEAAHASGESLSVEYEIEELPEEFRLVLKYGSNLSHELCNDALDPNVETIIDDSFIPVNGTLRLLVTPNGESTGIGDFPADIQVQIQNADFCADIGNGETHHENCFNVGEYTASAFIGWIPG
jgi:hypothetical protein